MHFSHGQERPKHLDQLVLLLSAQQQRGRSETEQPGLKPELIQDARAAGGSLTPCIWLHRPVCQPLGQMPSPPRASPVHLLDLQTFCGGKKNCAYRYLICLNVDLEFIQEQLSLVKIFQKWSKILAEKICRMQTHARLQGSSQPSGR